jgi:hypothetical protein
VFHCEKITIFACANEATLLLSPEIPNANRHRNKTHLWIIATNLIDQRDNSTQLHIDPQPRQRENVTKKKTSPENDASWCVPWSSRSVARASPPSLSALRNLKKNERVLMNTRPTTVSQRDVHLAAHCVCATTQHANSRSIQRSKMRRAKTESKDSVSG